MKIKEYQIEYRLVDRNTLEFDCHCKNVTKPKKVAGSVPIFYHKAFDRGIWLSGIPCRDRTYLYWLKTIVHEVDDQYAACNNGTQTA